MNYIGKSHYQIFFQSKELLSYHTITHISSKHHTSTQRVSVSLNINHRVAHFKFVTRLIVMKTCVVNQGSQWTFRVVMRHGYKENWFFWIFKDFQAREQLYYNAIFFQFMHL